MAIIYSYPMATPSLTDLLLGTYIDQTGTENHSSKSFSVQDIVTLAVNTTTQNGWNGVFDTSDILGVTVTNGIITNVQVIG